MSDLSKYNGASIEAMQLITDRMPASERQKIDYFLNQGFRLKLSTIVGNQPDVTLTLVNDLEQEILVYSLIGRSGEVLQ
jgi:hypothetical protein